MDDHDRLFLHQQATSGRHNRSWIRAARRQHPAPALTAAAIVDTISLAVAVDRDVAWVIYQAITHTLAAAIRGGRSIALDGFGTFKVRRLRTGAIKVSFKPEGDWWGWWMPVVAYSADQLQPIGIWDGPELLPFGHPDNPYATIDQVPFVPDWSFRAATPIAGEPPPAPYPHPVRPTRPKLSDAEIRAMRKVRKQRARLLPARSIRRF